MTHHRARDQTVGGSVEEEVSPNGCSAACDSKGLRFEEEELTRLSLSNKMLKT